MPICILKALEKASKSKNLILFNPAVPKLLSTKPLFFLLAEYVLTSKPTLLAEKPQDHLKKHSRPTPADPGSYAVGTQPPA